MNESSTEVIEATKPRVLVLIATIPARRRSCERLLAELAQQNPRKPDGVVLVLDGYGQAPAPVSPLPVVLEVRTDALSGAGQRWHATKQLPPDDIVICLDDDIMLGEAPRLVWALEKAVMVGGGAAAAMGRSSDGKAAPPGIRSRGDLIYGAGCSLTARAGHLATVQALCDSVVQAGGPDALGLMGDDDALVSAHLWKQGIRIRHAETGNIFPAPGTRTSSQTAARATKRESAEAQKLAIKRITGWPWPESITPSKMTARIGVRRG